MRPINFLLYVIIILLVQTIVLGRFNIKPDLVLVSVIIFSILKKDQSTYFFALAMSLLQDILSGSGYLFILINLIVVFIISLIIEQVDYSESLLVLVAVLVFSPLTILAEAAILRSFLGQGMIVISTCLNLLVAPIIYTVLKKVCHD